MSSHDFTRTPSIDTMLGKIKQMDSLEADIIKIAVMPEDYRDVLLLLETTLKLMSYMINHLLQCLCQAKELQQEF